MPTANEVDQHIRRAVAEGSVVDLEQHVLLGLIDTPTPDVTYAVVPPGVHDRQGWPDQGHRRNTDDTIVIVIASCYHGTYPIEWLGPGAMDKAQMFADWMATFIGGDFLDSHDIAVIEAGDPFPNNAVLGEKWEERAGLDLVVSYWTVREYDKYPGDDENATIGYFRAVPIAINGADPIMVEGD